MLKNMLVLCVGNAKLESAVLIHIPFMKAVLENQTQTQFTSTKFWWNSGMQIIFLPPWMMLYAPSFHQSQYICCCSILIRRRACNMSLPSQVTFRLFATKLIEIGRLSSLYKRVIYLKIGFTSFEFANKLNMFKFKYK